ncbi:uncharacterized protein LOC119559522 [Drosophila subpulchrella]|uniref:uncharacterized protein LOC119559522 n=1 Tax=Drosophila subpulchrella TaxID=1486046 RepID=UPI0018A13DF9|nr:uncharacterized protein LOC119559522 [Drosophila subpulchrella]
MAHWTISGFLVIFVLFGLSQASAPCNSDGKSQCVKINNCAIKKTYRTNFDYSCAQDETCCKLEDIDLACDINGYQKCVEPDLCKVRHIYHSKRLPCPGGLVCCPVQKKVTLSIDEPLD